MYSSKYTSYLNVDKNTRYRLYVFDSNKKFKLHPIYQIKYKISKEFNKYLVIQIIILFV